MPPRARPWPLRRDGGPASTERQPCRAVAAWAGEAARGEPGRLPWRAAAPGGGARRQGRWAVEPADPPPEHDTLVAAYLLDPARRGYPLDELATEPASGAEIEGADGGPSAPCSPARWPSASGAPRGGRADRPAARGRAAAGGRAARRWSGRGSARCGRACRRSAGASRPSRRAGAQGLGAGWRGVHDRLAPAAGRRPVRQARPVAQAARQDRLLHRRPSAAGDPRRARDRAHDRGVARGDQAQVDLPGRLPRADRRRRAPAHHLQPDGHRHRAPFEHQPQPAEHPHPHRAGPRDPRLLRGRARQPPDLGRLLAGRAAPARPHRRRARAQGDLPARRGRAHRHRRGDPGRQDRPRHALQGQDGQLRDRLRAVGLRAGRPPPDPPGGGAGVHRPPTSSASPW